MKKFVMISLLLALVLGCEKPADKTNAVEDTTAIVVTVDTAKTLADSTVLMQVPPTQTPETTVVVDSTK